MQFLNAQTLAENAYRTLGLPASASQAQIDDAARRMRLWPDPASIPPTDWDLPWLGPLRRTRIDIEKALATLNEPATRIEQRLLWFNDSKPQLWASGQVKQINKIISALPPPHGPALAHDITLAGLQLALLQDPEFRDLDRWGAVLVKVGALAESQPYLAYALAVEQDGRFEKSARAHEIESALRSLPKRLAQSIAAAAESAMEDDDHVTASRILSILRLGAPEGLRECEGRFAERLENLILRRCDHIHEDIDKIGAPKSSLKGGKSICAAQSKFYARSIAPLVRQLQQMSGAEPDRFLRARTEAARAKAHLAQAWAILREFRTAHKMLSSALELGMGTPVERPIRDNLERCRRAIKKLPPGPPNTSAPSLKSGQSYIPTYTIRTRQATKGIGKGWGVLIGVLIAIGRLASFSSSPSSSSHDYQTPHLPSVRPRLVLPSITDSFDVPQIRINDGVTRSAAYMQQDGFDWHEYVLDLTANGGDAAAEYAVVGREFQIKIVKPLLRDDRYHLITGPVGFEFNTFSGTGTWVPREDQVGRADVELQQEPAPAGPHLRLSIQCYRFDAPENLTATPAVVSRYGLSANPVQQARLTWVEPIGAQNLAGYRITVVNTDRSESKQFIAEGHQTSVVLPNLSSGLYQISIAAFDSKNAPGREAHVQFEISPQIGAP